MDAQTLLKDFSQMPLADIERFVQSLNALITQKKSTNKSYRERFLLGKINQTVLDREKIQRYQFLVRKLEAETITDIEYTEFMQLADEEEKIRYERLIYLDELAELKSMPLYELMDKMGLNSPAHG